MNVNQATALMCDYIRANGLADWLNDEIGIRTVMRPKSEIDMEAQELLDNIEAGNAEAVLEWVRSKIITANHIDSAVRWKDEQAAEARIYNFPRRYSNIEPNTGIRRQGEI